MGGFKPPEEVENMKQFKNNAEFTAWIESKYSDSMDDLIHGTYAPSDEEYVKMLLEEGYTDLEDLVESGEGYDFCGHMNKAAAELMLLTYEDTCQWQEYIDKHRKAPIEALDGIHAVFDCENHCWVVGEDRPEGLSHWYDWCDIGGQINCKYYGVDDHCDWCWKDAQKIK